MNIFLRAHKYFVLFYSTLCHKSIYFQIIPDIFISSSTILFIQHPLLLSIFYKKKKKCCLKLKKKTHNILNGEFICHIFTFGVLLYYLSSNSPREKFT